VTYFQSALSNVCCGTASRWVKSSRAVIRRLSAVSEFRARRSVLSGKAANGTEFTGVDVKASYIGIASASWRPSGRMPRINSIERSIDSWS
jgi:hypothetical protein